MKLLIDTNVILDLVFNRTNAAVSADVFRKISNNSDIALITASSATDLFYIIHKETHNSSIIQDYGKNTKNYQHNPCC